MEQKEREYLAGLATERVVGLFKTFPGAFYQDSVQHKLILLLQAIDRVAVATDKPILFSGIVPGFDLVILRNPDAPLRVPSNPAPLDQRALSSVDETCLALLSQAFEQHLAARHAERGSEEAGSFIYEGGDGLHYFGFRSQYRSGVLKEIGVSEDGLINVAAFIEGGKEGRVLQ